MRIKSVLILLITFVGGAFTQVPEINPNVKWTYVRNQEMTLNDKSVYQYEFPAEAGYDYIFNLSYNVTGVKPVLKVLDLQGKPLFEEIDEKDNKETQLSFRVPQSGTYQVVLGYTDSAGRNEQLPLTFTLIRRPVVE